MRIFITPSGTGENAWTGHCQHLVHLACISREKKHELTDDPHTADFILITDINDDDLYRPLRHHPLLKRYPEKTFTISEADRPFRFVPGIYTSMPRSPLNLNRFWPGIYSYYRVHYENPANAMSLPARTGELFFSFVGRATHPVRQRLFDHNFNLSDIVIRNTYQFNNFEHAKANSAEFHRSYVETCMKSRFVLCPAGRGTSSIRLYEVMEMGLVPVIISDLWVPPVGADWDSFAVFVKEKEIERIPELLRSHENHWRQMGDLARQNWKKWFQPEVAFNYFVDGLIALRQRRIVSERLIRLTWPFILGWMHCRRQFSRANVKKLFSRSGVRMGIGAKP